VEDILIKIIKRKDDKIMADMTLSDIAALNHDNDDWGGSAW